MKTKLLGLLKTISTITSLFFAVTHANADTHVHTHVDDPASVHGMLLVGTNQLYASHLPMYHSPHDYQAIVRVETVATRAVDPFAVYLKDKQTTGEKIYTIVPRPFVMPDIVLNKKSFHAAIYRGHFERGGVPIVRDALFEIRDVIHFRKLTGQANGSNQSQYIFFGNSIEAFAAHLIGAKPNFDQVTELVPGTPFDADSCGSAIDSCKMIKTIEGQSDQRPLEVGQEIAKGTRVLDSVYLEFGDLSH